MAAAFGHCHRGVSFKRAWKALIGPLCYESTDEWHVSGYLGT
jgi:hypothetical protein